MSDRHVSRLADGKANERADRPVLSSLTMCGLPIQRHRETRRGARVEVARESARLRCLRGRSSRQFRDRAAASSSSTCSLSAVHSRPRNRSPINLKTPPMESRSAAAHSGTRTTRRLERHCALDDATPPTYPGRKILPFAVRESGSHCAYRSKLALWIPARLSCLSDRTKGSALLERAGDRELALGASPRLTRVTSLRAASHCRSATRGARSIPRARQVRSRRSRSSRDTFRAGLFFGVY